MRRLQFRKAVQVSFIVGVQIVQETSFSVQQFVGASVQLGYCFWRLFLTGRFERFFDGCLLQRQLVQVLVNFQLLQFQIGQGRLDLVDSHAATTGTRQLFPFHSQQQPDRSRMTSRFQVLIQFLASVLDFLQQQVDFLVFRYIGTIGLGKACAPFRQIGVLFRQFTQQWIGGQSFLSRSGGLDLDLLVASCDHQIRKSFGN